MLSKLKEDWKFDENGVMHVVPKEYPDWYGISNIGFIWHNEWETPELEYKGKLFNSDTVEDTMWSRYREECEESGIESDERGFSKYMQDNANEVYELLDIIICEEQE